MFLWACHSALIEVLFVFSWACRARTRLSICILHILMSLWFVDCRVNRKNERAVSWTRLKRRLGALLDIARICYLTLVWVFTNVSEISWSERRNSAEIWRPCLRWENHIVSSCIFSLEVTTYVFRIQDQKRSRVNWRSGWNIDGAACTHQTCIYCEIKYVKVQTMKAAIVYKMLKAMLDAERI